MALPVETQLKVWGIAALVLFGLLWLVGDVLLPFVLGGALAYCLDPVADRLERLGLGRGAAVAIISIFGLLLFVILVLAVIPTIIAQGAELARTLPSVFERLRDFLVNRFPELMDENSVIRDQLGQLGGLIGERAGQLLSAVVGSFSGVVNIVLLFVIVPVVTIYLLYDWDRMVARVDELLPRDHAPTIRRLAKEVDKTLAGFIRGQGTVCLILGTFYAVALMIAGLKFGLVVGAVAGLLTFIPYVGAIVGGGLSIGLAIFQTWSENSAAMANGAEGAVTGVDWVYVLIIYAIFQVGQLVEGNFLTPKLVGDSVGLHPVWLLFALSVFGALFGFIGLLVAVPVAAVIGVFVRFAAEQYKHSSLYQGKAADGDENAEGDA